MSKTKKKTNQKIEIWEMKVDKTENCPHSDTSPILGNTTGHCYLNFDQNIIVFIIFKCLKSVQQQ